MKKLSSEHAASRVRDHSNSPLLDFHPVVREWFQSRFQQPTEPQQLGWPEIRAGRNVLIAAPTGSGKTLSAFMVCIDRLLRQSLEGHLPDETQVLYISPLKALSNDIRRNLEEPLREIQIKASERGLEAEAIKARVRTGDTPASERQAMVKQPPHILVTTPESLYLLLTSRGGRRLLRTIKTVIVDEIHALARDKRGSHLALSLERLDALCESKPVRIGLSATQKPLDQIAAFLAGSDSHPASRGPDCRIIDAGHLRQLDLQVEVPPGELSAVCSLETWQEIYKRLAELIESHRSTLVFVNTRRMAERVCHMLSDILGEDKIASHHGSLARTTRLSAEARLKAGELKAIVATASLELGIDIGYIDLVIQIGSPRSISTFLQRVGRSGHSLGLTPKGRLFALTRDELIECMALIRAIRLGDLDAIEIPEAPRDILAQQITAEVANAEWNEDDLFAMCRRAWPYRSLPRSEFDELITMLSEGIGQSRRGAYLHRDMINGKVRGRRGAQLSAVTSGGAIPDNAEYRVVTAGERTFVGTVNEDFAIESMAGDVFVLGNVSWRIEHIRGLEVVVSDAQGAPASIPFWFGEAPGRTVELSAHVARLREEIATRLEQAPSANADELETTGSEEVQDWPQYRRTCEWLQAECGVTASGAKQAVEYVAAEVAAIGLVPTQTKIVFERFFDEAGGMQLVVHAPFGSRINRAWGLAMRKRFCRQFDFELQASADDNGFVLSLGPQHSFPIEQLFNFLRRDNAEHNLTQALLAAPMFQVRWRWNITRSLVVLRQYGGKRVPPPLQRFRSEDMLTAVFPMQTACFEHRPEDVDIPDHPIVQQTVYDCLHEVMDLDRWLEIIDKIQEGRVELIARDTREPSPFSYELLNANPYAFLDDAPLEERRARAVATRRTLTASDVGDLTSLDPAAIEQVRAEAWPLVRDADELHDALLTLRILPEEEGSDWQSWFEELVEAGRATVVSYQDHMRFWIAAENWPLVQAALPTCRALPPVELPDSMRQQREASEGWVELVRGRVSCTGPVSARELARDLGIDQANVTVALEALEGEGYVLRGRFTVSQRALEQRSASGNDNQAHVDGPAPAVDIEWCERRLLMRIHRLTLDRLRKQIKPVEPEDFLHFLLGHQFLLPRTRLNGPAGLRQIVARLQGFEMPAAAWESSILSARLDEYDPAWLDQASLAGEVVWGRLQPPKRSEEDQPARSALTRVVPITLASRQDLSWLLPENRITAQNSLHSYARQVYETLQQRGAMFFEDLLAATQLLTSQLEGALSELAAMGIVTADGFAALRSIVSPNRKRLAQARRRRRRSVARLPHARGGRWTLFPDAAFEAEEDRVEGWAWQLLERYGVVFRDVLAREGVAPPWRELLPVYRRLEARGEIRGGRFIRAVAGEQFAKGETIDRLRQARDQNGSNDWLVISACDPVNLCGIVTQGPRIPAVRTNKLVIKNGNLIAVSQKGEVEFFQQVDSRQEIEIRRALRMKGIYFARSNAAWTVPGNLQS